MRHALSPKRSCSVWWSAAARTSCAIRFVSVFAFSVVNVFDDGMAGDAVVEGGLDAGAEGGASFWAGSGAVAGAGSSFAAGRVGLDPPMLREIVGGAAGASACGGRSMGNAAAGGTGGRAPPMLSEMVGGGAGASACGGRSIGAEGAPGGGCCWGSLKPRPGTNSKAPALSLLLIFYDLWWSVRGWWSIGEGSERQTSPG